MRVLLAAPFDQVLFMTGVIMAVAQLVIFPPVIKILGVVKWMRIGCLLGISTFLAIPNVTFFSWNYSTLFAVSVAGVTVVNCCLAAVSEQKSWMPSFSRALGLLCAERACVHGLFAYIRRDRPRKKALNVFTPGMKIHD